MARPKISIPVWLRRITQSAVALLFLYLFVQTVYKPVNQTGKGVKLFFELDPLVLLTNWIATHQIVSGLLISLIVVGVTLVAGRWFCGWICPFGALHNFLTSLRREKPKQLIAVGGYTRWQRSKYYILIAVLAGAALGLNLVGWFDPFSFLYRAMTVAVYPSASDSTKTTFAWIYEKDPGIGQYKVTAASEPVYEVLRRNVLPASQPHYYASILIAGLFLAIVLLILYRARFWCRYISPLGALLGVIGKNPLVRLKRVETKCNDCKLCVMHCQGGADPQVSDGWRPAECFYCWNCRASCPHHGIKFSIGPAKEGKK